MYGRSPARRRPVPRRYGEGHLAVFMGPVVLDGHTGESVPLRFATKQDGVYVDKRLWKNGFDRPRWYTFLAYLIPLLGMAKHWY